MDAVIDVTDVEIETARLLLRPIQQEDLGDYHEILTDPQVGKNSGWVCSQTLEDSQRRLDKALEGKEELALIWKETGKMIGTFAIQSRPWEIYPVERSLRGREFGFDLNRQFWGRGLMPEAVEAVTEYCFRELGYDFVTCGHFQGNDRSSRVIVKCGFAFLFEDDRTMPAGNQVHILTYIRYNPYKEKNYV